MTSISVEWHYRLAGIVLYDKDILVRVLFIGQRSDRASANPVAVIELPDGSVEEVDPSYLTFADEESSRLKELNALIDRNIENETSGIHR